MPVVLDTGTNTIALVVSGADLFWSIYSCNMPSQLRAFSLMAVQCPASLASRHGTEDIMLSKHMGTAAVVTNGFAYKLTFTPSCVAMFAITLRFTRRSTPMALVTEVASLFGLATPELGVLALPSITVAPASAAPLPSGWGAP